MSKSTICQNCKNNFGIEEDDFSFYEKMGVPPPTFCPECRLLRRMNNTNERALYKRTCDLTGKTIISMFPSDTPFPVYGVDDWYNDGWDPSSYAMEYNFSRPFFDQFLELQNKVPRMSLVRQGNSINSEYCHRIDSPKNCYMAFRSTRSEECAYIYVSLDVRDCVDCSFVSKSELCYECVNVEGCYHVTFSQESIDCRDSAFLYGCHNCSNCVGCVNLRNREYCIWNEQYSKEEYFKKAKELNLNTHTGIGTIKKAFLEFRKQFPQKAVMSTKSNNVSGNWFTNSQNVQNSYFSINVKDGKNLWAVFDSQDCHDYFQWGNHAELIYESENCGINVSRLFSCSQCWMGAHDLMYCDSCPGAGNCFGCIGLKKGEYSILNKQYSKEEYETLLPKIKQHMIDMPYVGTNNRIYSFGEHFPFEISPFAYNETAAIDFFPITKEEAESKGYIWKDKEKIQYPVSKNSSDLPETITEVSDDILNEIISCAESDKEYSPGAFKITEQELLFYRKMNLPLPRVSYPVRYMNRLRQRPPLKIIERKCSKCNTSVQTVYTVEFAPILYCESCYQQEVI
jgi:hypothetical protein